MYLFFNDFVYPQFLFLALLTATFILTHSFNYNFLSTYYIFGSNQRTGNTMVDKTDKISVLTDLTLCEETDHKWV